MPETLKELIEHYRQTFLAQRDTAMEIDPVNGERVWLDALRQTLTDSRIKMNSFPSYHTDTNFAATQIAGKRLLRELDQ